MKLTSTTALAFALASCFDPSYPGPGLACPDGVCPPGQTCVAGSCQAETGGMDAATLDVSTGDAAVDAEAPDAPCQTTCTSAITLFDCAIGASVDCALGCSTVGGDHCRVLQPSNDPDALTHVSAASAPIDVSGTAIYDVNTDTGEIRESGPGSVIRPAGTGVLNGIGYEQTGSIGVFSVTSLTVASGARLRARGTRALLILSAGDVTIRGFVDVRAGICPDAGVDLRCGGPGGGNGGDGMAMSAAVGCAPGGPGLGTTSGGESGGGGGAFGGAGGDGGNADVLAGGAGGVPVATCVGETLVPLVGGSGAGHGGGGPMAGGSGVPGGDGGGGGGAVQITSYTRILVEPVFPPTTLSGVSAGGQGGGGGPTGMGGGGGGSGGAILLEAPVVEVRASAWLAANGGGGGGGGGTNFDPDGTNGEAGRLDGTPALGGTGRAAGAGGAGMTAAQNAPSQLDGAGGGGGGVGRVRINAEVLLVDLGTSSPQATTGPVTSD